VTEEWNPSSGVDVQRYAPVLWRRRWWVAATIAITLLVAVVAGRSGGGRGYRASADVLAKPIAMNPLATPTRVDQAVDLDTESRILGSPAVAKLAGAKLAGPDPGDRGCPPDRCGGSRYETPEALAVRVATTVSADTQVMSVTFTAPIRSGAEDGALAFAQAYLDYKAAEASATLATITDTLRARIAELDGALAAASAAMAANLEGTAAFLEAQGNRDLVTSQIGLLHDQLAAHAGVEIDPGDVVRATAAVPVRSREIPVPVAAAMGLLAGMAVAFGRDRLDNRLHWTGQVRRLGGLPLLAAVPRRARARRRGPIVDPQSPESEAFHRFSTNLATATGRGRAGGRIVLITSPSPREGKTTVAANLAVAFARTGRRVAVVSADLRFPGLQRAFSLPDGPTLNDLLEGNATADDIAVRPSAWPDVTVYRSGVSTSHPAEDLQSPAMTGFLEELRATHDDVIVDAPPVLPVADALFLAAAADATVVVARQHRTTDVALAGAIDQLAQAGARLAGAVVNQTRRVRITDGYHAYSSEGRRLARRRHELAVVATAGVALVAVAGSAAAVGFGWPGGDASRKEASAAATSPTVLGVTVTRPPDAGLDTTTTTLAGPPVTAPPVTTMTRPAETTTTTRPKPTTTTTAKPVTTTTVPYRIAPGSATAAARGVAMTLEATPGSLTDMHGRNRSVALRLGVRFTDVRVLRSVKIEYGDGKVIGGAQINQPSDWQGGNPYECHDPPAPTPYVLIRPARQMDRSGVVTVTVTVVTATCSTLDDDFGPEETAVIRLNLDIPPFA
jgi:capsular exopolysaccharide synthesis family protein